MITARNITGHKFSVLTYHSLKASHQRAIELGEVYFVGGPWHGQAAVLLFGPGSYWRGGYEDGVPFYGQALDADEGDHDMMVEILAARRRGEIWGLWHSAHCPAGDLGFLHYAGLEKIDLEQYQQTKGIPA